jgi:hypothetical protein
VPALAVTVTGPAETGGQATVIEADAFAEPSLLVLTLAVLLSVTFPAQEELVALITWTCVLELAPSVVGAYARLWFGAEPVTDHPASLFGTSMDQFVAAPPGKRSVTDKPVAAAAPVLLMVTL